MRRTSLFIALAIAPLLIAATVIGPACAEVRKAMTACDGPKLCASYQVVLAPPDGWVIDDAASAERGVQILVPNGQTFDTASALIYLQVFYQPDTKLTLANFARDSNTRWQSRVPGATAVSQAAAARKNRQPAFLCFAYDNPAKQGQTYELGAFGPDTDRDGNPFVVNVVLSGLDKPAVDRAAPVYLALLKNL